MKTKFLRGISLIEVMVVVGVLAILVSVAAPSLADMLNRRRVAMVAAELSTDLAFARSEVALRPGIAATVTVFFRQTPSMTCYTMAYYGGVGDCNCTSGPGNACSGNGPSSQVPEIKTTQVRSSVGVTIVAPVTVTRMGALSQVGFTWPHLTASPTNFAVTVTGSRGSSLRVKLNGMGRVETCSPDGTFTGYVRC